MSRSLKALALVSCLSLPAVVAQAADGGTEAFSPSNFALHMKVTGRYMLLDSSQNQPFDFVFNTARLGLTYNYKNVASVLEFQAASPAKMDTAAPTETAYNKSNALMVRQAHVDVSFLQNSVSTLTIVVGRDRIAGSKIYSTDAISAVSLNFDNASSTLGEDGVGLRYVGKYSFGKVLAGVGYYTNAGFTLPQDAGKTPFIVTNSLQQINFAYGYGNQSWTASRAMLGYLGFDLKAGKGSIELRALYANQPNVPISNTNATTVAAGMYRSRDADNMEFSANYIIPGFMGGAWYSLMNLGQMEASNAANSNDVSYVPIAGAMYQSQMVSTFGVGFQGDSSVFGVTDMIESGDAWNYGAGYQKVAGYQYGGEFPIDVNQYSISGGYQMGPVSMSLNYLNAVSTAAIYLNAEQKNSYSSANYSQHTQAAYLMGVFSL